jgi:hypothetical protein
MVTPPRTAASVLNPQYVQPVFESSEYTTFVRVPRNTRPPTITGWERAMVTEPRLKAHFTGLAENQRTGFALEFMTGFVIAFCAHTSRNPPRLR